MSPTNEIISLIILISCNLSQTVYSELVEKCRNVSLIDNADLNRAGGIWHTIETSDPRALKKKCYSVDIAPEKNKSGLFTVYDITDNDRKEIYQITSVNGTSMYKVHADGDRSEAGAKDGWLIATDYTNYSVWHVCISGAEDGGFLYTGVRHLPANKNVIKKTHEILKKIGFKLSNLGVISLNGCT